MRETAQPRWDLLLLGSLLLVVLMYPLLDHGDIRRLILGAIMFGSVILTTVRISQIKASVWPSMLLMSGALIFAVASTFFASATLTGIKWVFLTAFFAQSVLALFRYVRNSRSVGSAHLSAAASIYLLIGMQWFALYAAIDAFRPGCFLHSASAGTDRQAELLYFSLVTLSTVGYGDIVALNGEVRMLAALEGITGVLYIAITVALLVNSYKQRSGPSEVAGGTNEIN